MNKDELKYNIDNFLTLVRAYSKIKPGHELYSNKKKVTREDIIVYHNTVLSHLHQHNFYKDFMDAFKDIYRTIINNPNMSKEDYSKEKEDFLSLFD